MPENQPPIRIMIVGDDSSQRQRVAELLGQHSHPVSPGLLVSTRDAVDRASRANPELLLMLFGDSHEAAVRHVRQVRGSCHAYIIAVGPVHDARLILNCLHSGADEYLDEQTLADDLLPAISRFGDRQGLRQSSAQPGKVIGVLGASGGVGASTIAVNVAAVLARTYERCGLVDLRLQSRDLSSLLNLRPQFTLADFCANTSRIDQNVFSQMWTVHPGGIELLAAPWNLSQASLVTPDGLRLLLALGRSRYKYILLDVDNRSDELQLEALWQSDSTVLVTRMDYVSVRNARRMLDYLSDVGIEASRIRVVANRFGQRHELSVAQAESALGTKIQNFVVDDPGRVNRFAGEGKIVATGSTWSRISRNLGQLAAAVNGGT